MEQQQYIAAMYSINVTRNGIVLGNDIRTLMLEMECNDKTNLILPCILRCVRNQGVE